MSDYDAGGTRPEDDYHRARQEADRAGHDHEGNQAWKQAQDDMFRARREIEWQRQDATRARSEGGDGTSYALPPDRATRTQDGSLTGRSAPRSRKVSFAIADSLATSVAGMTRTHPGLFIWVFRGIAWGLCWPIPIAQRFLDRRGVRNPLLRFFALLFIWMAYLAVIDAMIIFAH